jgi:copper ion binding protein
MTFFNQIKDCYLKNVEVIFMSKTKTTFRVSGMSCGGCSASIGRALSRLDGIDKAEADHEKGSTDVVFDEKTISKDKIIETIENLGYKVEGEM